ncbi:hypothetical protein D4764_06G0005330 [Takifugu flavidus]|uniref:Uncharacterized protein n=1 Tax=Takifugu flavidus TaxID=433684 RepID=A0A5C6MVK1_9TELE|nr:hypothetical protein D4764_06G0005330 [Takifugu flavidus]
MVTSLLSKDQQSTSAAPIFTHDEPSSRSRGESLWGSPSVQRIGEIRPRKGKRKRKRSEGEG